MSGQGGAPSGSKSSAGQVAGFLERFIEVMDKNGLDIWTTVKNKKFEADTGFIASDAEDVIKALSHKNYNDGPQADDNPNRDPGEVWTFNAELLGEGIYLKLKLEGANGSQKAACLSFHEPERPMETPLKVNGRGQLSN